IIEHGIARLCIAQEIHQRNPIVRRTCQSAHNELKVRRREARPTIRLDHREPILSLLRAKEQESTPRLVKVFGVSFGSKIAQGTQAGEKEVGATPDGDELR